jgi:hypothetical protein
VGAPVWHERVDDCCYGVAVFQSEIYATGSTTGVMAGTANAGDYDMFVTRITALGVVVWTAQLGSAGDDYGRGIAVDSSGVYVTGYTGGSLSGQPYAGGDDDAFVARYTHAGAWVWTRLLGTSVGRLRLRRLRWTAAATCSSPASTHGALSGQANAGSSDAFVASFTSGGVLQWTRLYGTSVDRQWLLHCRGQQQRRCVCGGLHGAGSMYGQPSCRRPGPVCAEAAVCMRGRPDRGRRHLRQHQRVRRRHAQLQRDKRRVRRHGRLVHLRLQRRLCRQRRRLRAFREYHGHAAVGPAGGLGGRRTSMAAWPWTMSGALFWLALWVQRPTVLHLPAAPTTCIWLRTMAARARSCGRGYWALLVTRTAKALRQTMLAAST